MKKSSIIKGIIVGSIFIALTAVVSISTIKADSLYSELGETQEISENVEYGIEEMLLYAINSEYLAEAEYQAIIAQLGSIRPFTNIVLAEGTHIEMLETLFTTYGLTLPENSAANQVVIPETISQAIATGIESEQTVIAIYEQFLSQTNLPDDVRSTFEYLLQASINHLTAFQKDRAYGYGQDLAQGIKNMFQYRKGNGTGNGVGNSNRSQLRTCIGE